jgi:cellulose synthase (UDP-forming)
MQAMPLTGDHIQFSHLLDPENVSCCLHSDENAPWTAMPDLQLFASTGFPFTQKADLSETTVVLPASMTPEMMEVYLTLIGRLGSQVGHPLLNVSVSGPDGLKSDGTKDYLVLDVGADQPAMRALNSTLPVAIDSEGLHPRDPQGFFAPVRHAWWRLRDWEDRDSGKLDTSGVAPEVVMEGAEWPVGSGRSVVVVSARDKESAGKFMAAYPELSKASEIAGSVSVLDGGKFTSYRIGDEVYYRGSRSPWMATRLVFGAFPWLLILAVTAVSVMMAGMVRTILRQKAKERLLVCA